MSSASAFTIDDLAAPRLDAVQRAALKRAAAVEVDFSPEILLAAARQRTGLDDFGPDDFRTRLQILCEAWGSDAGLTGAGRLALWQKLVQHLSSRLLIEQQWQLHPEILDLPVERPIIVAGLPRSGTTHLLNLMAADDRLQSLPLWQSYEPVPLPDEAATEHDVDPRYRRCADSWAMSQRLVPLLGLMHPMDPDHIHEELELMGPNIGSYNYEWLSHTPVWRDYYLAEDQTPHYRYMKNVLKLLSWQRGESVQGRRWVLKCPQHLEQLNCLLRVFPDATVVITHRDPVAVIQSIVTMLAYGQRINRERPLIAELADYWCDRVERLLRRCVEDRELLSPSMSLDLPFAELLADDVRSVERVYSLAGLRLTEDARAALTAFSTGHARGVAGRIKYDLRGQFGVDPVALRERFAFYFERFGLQPDEHAE